MKFLHLTEDKNGVSHFSDGEITLSDGQFAPPAPVMPVSTPESCKQVLHLSLPAGWTGALHPSPCRQIAYCLAGHARIVAGDGDAREVSPGDIWRMEDTNGAGHQTTVLGDVDVYLAIVQLV